MRADILTRVRTGTYLNSETFPALSWAVPGLIPEGFGLFTGPPKAGKSWATLGVVLAVASGGRALGSVPVGAARPVLLLALEDGERRLQDRCRRLLGDDPIPERLNYVTRVTPAEVLDLIRAWLAIHGNERPLVVLDTLGKVTPPALPGESAYARDYRIGGHLKALSDDHPGTTLLVVHHVRKAASDDWMDSTSGTNGLNGAADFTVSLSRPRNEADGVLRVTGRDVPESEYAITVAEGSWSLRGTSLADAARAAQQARAVEGLGDTSARLVEYVTGQPAGVRARDVATELGIDEKDASTYLLRAEKSGRIARLDRGLYGPPVGSVGSVGTSYSSDTSYTPCRGCGAPLDPWLADTGETTHVGCEVAA